MKKETERENRNNWFVGLDEVSNYVPNLNWILKKIILANTIIGFVGKPKSGKSCIVYDILMSFLHGFSNWLGIKMKGEKRDCVLLTSEGDSKKRLKGWLIAHNFPQPKGKLFLLDYSKIEGGIKFNDLKVQSIIEQIQSSSNKVGLVVIDTLNGFYKGKENDNSDMGDFLNYVVQISQALQSTVIIIHHLGKNETDSEGRGASAFGGRVDETIKVTGKILTGSTVTVISSRETEEGLRFKVKAKLVNLTSEPDEDGDFLTTIVIDDSSPITLETAEETAQEDEDLILLKEGISEKSIHVDNAGFITRKNLSDFYSSHGGNSKEGYSGKSNYAQSKPREEGGKGACARLQDNNFLEWNSEKKSYRVVDISLFQ